MDAERQSAEEEQAKHIQYLERQVELLKVSLNVSLHVIRDQRDILKDYKEKLKQLGYDRKTGALTADQFEAQVRHVLSQISRASVVASLIYIDVDNLKQVNDTLGHHAGDNLLAEVAKLLHRSVRDGDYVGRIGGDEFGLLMIGDDDLEATCSRICELSQELPHGTTLSLGATVLTRGMTVSAAMRIADLAMYRAKRERIGRSNYKIERVTG